MRDIRMGAAQFEQRDGDKDFNLARIAELTHRAARQGAEVVSFHECCICGYTFLQQLDRANLMRLAEPVPGGPSIELLRQIARKEQVVVMAGLIEVEQEELYNTYAVVGPEGLLGKHRKLHPFIHPDVRPGNTYTVLDVLGVPMGLLTCYDNNLPENVRITTLMGAEVIVMPHVTGCLPSAMPGRGTVDAGLWANRHRDPARVRLEFVGPKGRGWLMRWLPARAWENGVFVVFSNAIGVDGDTIKPGLAMILDPHGEVLAESHALEDDVAVGLLTPELLENASGRRYVRARRPDLYGRLVEPPPADQPPETRPGWK